MAVFFEAELPVTDAWPQWSKTRRAWKSKTSCPGDGAVYERIPSTVRHRDVIFAMKGSKRAASVDDGVLKRTCCPRIPILCGHASGSHVYGCGTCWYEASCIAGVGYIGH